MKADLKKILAIHDAVITHNRRISISGDLRSTFNLHVEQVAEEDRGEYMCQINTDPMKYQVRMRTTCAVPTRIQNDVINCISISGFPEVQDSDSHPLRVNTFESQ